jgi:hypothetical protein
MSRNSEKSIDTRHVGHLTQSKLTHRFDPRSSAFFVLDLFKALAIFCTALLIGFEVVPNRYSMIHDGPQCDINRPNNNDQTPSAKAEASGACDNEI